MPRLRVKSVTPEIVVAHLELCDLSEKINLDRLGRELFALVEQKGCRRLVVHLGPVRIVAAAALGKLISLHRKMRRLHGQLLFCHVHPQVTDILRASHLHTYLQIVPDLDAALATFSHT